MLLAIAAIVLLMPPAAVAGIFPPAQMRQMPGAPAAQIIAIQHMPPQPIKQCEVEFLSRNLHGLIVWRRPEAEDKGIVLFRMSPGVDDKTAQKAVAEFLKNNKAWVGVPVIRAPGLEKIPTNNFVIQFKPEVTPTQAQEIFSTYGIEVIERPTEHSRGRYVLRLPRSPAAKVLELTTTLSLLPAVEFAQPDYILLFKRQ